MKKKIDGGKVSTKGTVNCNFETAASLCLRSFIFPPKNNVIYLN